ncbi:MAG TPA: CRTAC1 family protein [Terriglobales bacterium]|nr:CRTAC1 family protein [Terriglobales bacterium]
MTNEGNLRRSFVEALRSVWGETSEKAVVVAALLALASTGCSRSKPGSDQVGEKASHELNLSEPWFEEISSKANLNFKHSSGHTSHFYIPEMESGGVGLIDYDNDGLLDIFCVNGGSLDPAVTNRPSNRLYRNLGNWRFEDVTGRAGVGGHGEYGMGCACGDYNGDGWVDIYVTNVGTNVLYRNNGNGTFTDVTREAGVGGGPWGTSAAFFDYDGDGHLDLVVANYIHWSRDREVDCFSRGGLPDYCSPLNYKSPAMDTLYHNRGDGTFENFTIPGGLDKTFGNGLGVVCADLNHDGKPDIFIANDAMPNQLWINMGNGKFTDEAMIRGCAVNRMGIAEAGMGVAAVDLYQRGWLDLFVTHLEGEGNRLWVNTNGYFTDLVASKGPGAPSLPFTGFGLAFADFDNDGQLDVYVANGKVKRGQREYSSQDHYAEPNTLLRGLGNGEFEDVIPQGGVAKPLIATSRGIAIGDLDNDGGIDIVVVNRDAPAHLLRNLVSARGHWIKLRVMYSNGVAAIGASVRIEVDGKTFWRDVNPNEGYCSSNDPRIHCGLGAAQNVNRVVVRWPDGIEEGFGPFQQGRVYEIRKGAGRELRNPSPK